ncbi:MAG: acetoacetate--CoA ligase [Actinomycetota bacterium]|nr:acetoacetate--CoA ligase [Actinomycetota bacterium]
MPTAAPILWDPTEADRAGANVTRFLEWLSQEHGLAFADYGELWRWSVDELEAFWESIWRYYGVEASGTWSEVLASRDMPGARWFDGARLNYAEHVLARGTDERPALVAVAEGEAPREISWATLRGEVGALAATLRELGVEPGDRVAAYLPNIPESVVAVLAVTSLGAVWTSCAPDFGTRSVVDRLGQVDPTVLIAVDGYRFNGRQHDHRETIAELQQAMPSLTATILIRSLRPDDALPDALGALAFDELTRHRQEPTFERVPFDHPLWILFSSGTTGLPKGIVQGHGGILLEHLKSLGLCLDIRRGDRYFFYSSTSWMAWNYLVSGLLHEAVVIQYNGSPVHGGTDALWQVAAETRATILGMGSAYAAGCQKAGVDLTDVRAAGALRIVIPTGSPLAPGGWRWLHEQLGPQVRIDSILGGTDVCTAFFGGSQLLPVRLGEISCRWLGVHAEAYDDEGRPVTDDVGEFVLVKPLPSMPVGFWKDPDGSRYHASYFDVFPGVWRQGDWITLTSQGSILAAGRSDATLNRAGVRLGSAEIYAVVEGLAEVADSLVAGVELPDGEYYMPLFVVAAGDAVVDDDLRARIAAELRSELSPRHVPDEIVEVPAIPRTLTGKKLEVPVKRILQGVPAERAAAAGSLDRPEAIQWFERFAQQRLGVRA